MQSIDIRPTTYQNKLKIKKVKRKKITKERVIVQKLKEYQTYTLDEKGS